MCLILFALGHHPRYPLLIAANRDEAYHRPATPLAFWPEHPEIAAGRDLEAGGTWLGITRKGRWAALTNFRQATTYKQNAPSRGRLVSDYLEGELAPEAYLEQVARHAQDYNGFNLLVGSPAEAAYLSNREDRPRRVSSGVHGLSNHLLDTPWPKVVLGTRALSSLPDAPVETVTAALLSTLGNRVIPQDQELPDTGVGLPRERMLSPPFITSDTYGTRASTVILVDRHGDVSMAEHRYGPQGTPDGASALTFSLEPSASTRGRS